MVTEELEWNPGPPKSEEPHSETATVLKRRSQGARPGRFRWQVDRVGSPHQQRCNAQVLLWLCRPKCDQA